MFLWKIAQKVENSKANISNSFFIIIFDLFCSVPYYKKLEFKYSRLELVGFLAVCPYSEEAPQIIGTRRSENDQNRHDESLREFRLTPIGPWVSKVTCDQAINFSTLLFTRCLQFTMDNFLLTHLESKSRLSSGVKITSPRINDSPCGDSL